MIVRVAATIEELKRNLAEGKSQIETTTAAMQKLASSFSGDKLIQAAQNVTAAVNQIGGVSKLTDAEMARVNTTLEKALEKYRVLGREAPAGMQALADATRNTETAQERWGTALGSVVGLLGAFGIGLSVSALTAFARGIFDSAGALVDLHDKTGVSLEQLQRWNFVGAQAGVTTDQFADASFKLGVKLSGGSGSVRDAVEKLGLSYTQLRTQSPDQQFNAIAKALEAMEDPQERNRLGVELFGKSFAAIAPAIVKGYSDMAAAAQVSSDEQLKGYDRASDAWTRFVANQKTSLTSMGGDVILVAEQFGAWKTALSIVAPGMASLAGISFNEMRASVQATSKAMAEFTGPIQEQTASTKNYTIELVKAMVEVNHLSAAQIESIEAAQRLGKSTDDLVNEFGISEGALKVITERTREHADAQRKAAEEAKKFGDAMTELNSAGQGWKGTLDSIDGTVVEAIKFYLQAGVSQKALAEAYGLTDTQVRAIASSLKDETDAQARSAAAASDHAKAARDAADALDKEAEQLKKVKQHAEETAAAERKAAEAKKALNMAMGSTLDLGHAARDPEIMELLHMGWSLENAQAIKLARQYGFTPALFSPKGQPETTPDPSERVPGYAGGVRNAPGGWAMVGERGPEPMYVPPGADIYPSGSSAGGPTVLNVYVTQPLASAAAVAKAVDDAVVKRMRDRGFRY